ncbi:hypothetical protein C8R44DRAFT_758863 [Mycena epipterygia]|nr:hypothetical protein C8R44DRAFT_758863 [Mycena epipterygia]
MPSSPHKIRIIFSYEDGDKKACQSSITHTTNEYLDPVFRHVEAVCGKKKGSLAFCYNHNWLQDTDTPLALEMKDGATVNCVVVLKIAILHPNSGPQFFTVDPADVSLPFSRLFAAYGTLSGMDPVLLHFTHNGRQLMGDALVVETLGLSDDGFLLVAMPANGAETPAEAAAVMIRPSSPIRIQGAAASGSEPEHDTSEAILLELRGTLLVADANWLGTLIHTWPDGCPPQDEEAILWNFARRFMAWRDSVIQRAKHGETGSKFLGRQMEYIGSLERLHDAWKREVLEAWGTYKLKSAELSGAGHLLEDAIQANVATRLLRERRAVSTLGLLIGAWKTHIAGGLAVLSSGPGLHSDLRILRECRAVGEIEEVLDLDTRDEVTTGATNSAEEYSNMDDVVCLDESPSPDDIKAVEEPPKRRQSTRLRRNKDAPTPSFVIEHPPPSALVHATRPPLFVTRSHTLPSRILRTRREQIQHEWNKIAREAGAAGLEFVNEIDDEEVPPGIGVLFPYVERSYLFDIGIAETSSLVGCQCDDMVGCDDAGECSCQAELEDGPIYTPQGLFAFNTESEIVECNSYCACPPKCANRVAQFPRRLPVQIFKTEKRGWGARMPVDLVRGRIVGLYTGLLIRREEADKLSGSRASYCFDLDINEEPDEDPPENSYSVDAYGCGNWTRFINHSCSPNLQIISVVYDTMPGDNMPYLALVATENIPAYTELTFDYNPAHQTEWELKRYREKTRSKKNKSKKQTRCLCGTSKCRGWLSVVA